MAMRSKSKRFPRLNIQTLEPRENPAGLLIGVNYSATGLLTISGGDDSSDISVNFTTGVVTGNDGETFTVTGAPGVVKGLSIKLAGGDDIVRSVAADTIAAGTGAFNIDLGDGDNQLLFGNLTAITSGPITYNGGDGNDTVTIGTTAASTITGAVTATSTVGDLDLTLASSTAAFIDVTGGVTVSNNYGHTNVTLDTVKTTKVTASGGDANTSSTGVFVQATDSTFSGLIFATAKYANAKIGVTGGFMNGASVTTKGHGTFTGTDINLDTVPMVDVGVPTGNVTVNAGRDATITITQSAAITDFKIGNLTAIGAADADITVSGTGANGAKSIGNVSAKAITDSASVTLSNAFTAGTISATGVNGAAVTTNTVGTLGTVSASSSGPSTVDVTTATKTGNLTAKGASATVSTTAAQTIGAVTATGTNSGTINITTATATGNLAATGANSASVGLSAVQKTGTVSATAVMGSAFVSLNSSTTGDAMAKGGNVTATGQQASVFANGGTDVVNGSVTAKATKFGAFVGSNATAFTVHGTTSATGISGAGYQQFAGTNTYDGAVTVSATSPYSNVVFTVAGAAATFSNNVTVKTGGASSTNFSTTGAGKILGDFAFTGGQWQDAFNFSPTFEAKNVKIDAKNGNTTVTLGAAASATLIPISGNLTVTSGFGVDQINLLGVSVTGLTTLATGANSDTVKIENSTLSGASKIDTGAGDDSLLIATNAAANAATLIGGLATYNLGAGNDILALGDATPVDAQAVVTFTAATTSLIDGGTGLDDLLADPSAGAFSLSGATSRLFNFES